MVADAVLTVEHVTKTYASKCAVDDVSFHVGRREIVGLLGPNGAGKTTIINMILGVLIPTSGSVSIGNCDLLTSRTQALSMTNFAAVYAALPGNMTVYENLKIFGLLYDIYNLPARIDTVLGQFNLLQYRHTKCGVLSSGEQTRVNLAKAMLNEPSLLLLDEPTASLDPATAQDIRHHIKNFAKSGQSAVVWTSHNMAEMEDLCDRVIFISQGKLLLQGDPRTLPQEHGKSTLEDLFLAVAREPLSIGGTA